MNKKLFDRLVESVKQASEIVRGERAPSRVFHVDERAIKGSPSRTKRTSSAKVKSSGESSTKNTAQGESATPSTKPSADLVRSPRTGKMIHKNLNDEILRQQEALKNLDWRKRRVF